MLDFVNRLYARLTVRDEEGQGMVEYGLIISFVMLIVFVSLSLLGPKVAELFNKASASL